MNRDILEKMGEELKYELAKTFATSLMENNFEDCDKLLHAYESYKRGYQAVQKLPKLANIGI